MTGEERGEGLRETAVKVLNERRERGEGLSERRGRSEGHKER